MNSLSGPKKIIWAISAFERPGRTLQSAAQAIRTLALKSGATIEPVYVLSPQQLNLAVELNEPLVEQYEPAAQSAMHALLREVDLPGLVRPHVIVQDFTSTAQAASALSSYAVNQGADLIVVNTHGRSGMKRMLLGSFTETLLLCSRIPVVVVGPDIRRTSSTDLRNIIFPTEFGRYSKSLFRRIVSMARAYEAKITLFHAIPHPIEPVLQSGVYLLGGAWVPVQAYFSSEIDRRQKHADAWARWAENEGVEVDVLIDIQGAHIVDTILELARERRAGLIAMAAQSTSFAATFLGSITRQVIRHAPCPVWVVRPAVAARATLPRSAREAGLSRGKEKLRRAA